MDWNEKKNDWQYWDSIGFIAGPNESKEQFFARIQHCLCLRDNLIKSPNHELPEVSFGNDVNNVLAEAFTLTKGLYGITPYWVPLAFSNWKLAPWHGGCTWIFKKNEESALDCLLQMRKHFLNHKEYLSIYRRNELISHECAHIGRMAFDEPKFEELLAYRSNTTIISRLFGGIITSGIEAVIFVLSLLLVIVGDILLFTLNVDDWYEGISYLKIIPLALIFLGIARLLWRKNQLNKCLMIVQKITVDVNKANAVVYRLSDKEIILFGKISQNKILDYIENAKQHSIRWRVIAEAYLKN